MTTNLNAAYTYTVDPDAYYLRPATYVAMQGGQMDLGGPDGLGPYIRVNFDNGRALLRVRYAPSDANVFSSSPDGPLRNPGVVHNFLILEAVGRQGTVNVNDPTTLALNQQPVPLGSPLGKRSPRRS